MFGRPPHQGSGLRECADPRISGLSLVRETDILPQTCRSSSTAGISHNHAGASGAVIAASH